METKTKDPRSPQHRLDGLEECVCDQRLLFAHGQSFFELAKILNAICFVVHYRAP